MNKDRYKVRQVFMVIFTSFRFYLLCVKCPFHQLLKVMPPSVKQKWNLSIQFSSFSLLGETRTLKCLNFSWGTCKRETREVTMWSVFSGCHISVWNYCNPIIILFQLIYLCSQISQSARYAPRTSGPTYNVTAVSTNRLSFCPTLRVLVWPLQPPPSWV